MPFRLGAMAAPYGPKGESGSGPGLSADAAPPARPASPSLAQRRLRRGLYADGGGWNPMALDCLNLRRTPAYPPPPWENGRGKGNGAAKHTGMAVDPANQNHRSVVTNQSREARM